MHEKEKGTVIFPSFAGIILIRSAGIFSANRPLTFKSWPEAPRLMFFEMQR
jgi:hypothetical protein